MKIKLLFLFQIITSITLFHGCGTGNDSQGNKVTETYSVDICVYGGTSGGVIAAYAAKKEGKKVLLIEPTNRLGGLTSGGLGRTDLIRPEVINGLSKDFYDRIGRYYGKSETQYVFEPKAALQVFNDYIKEGQIDVQYNTRITGALKRGNTLKEITVENTKNGKTYKIKGKIFIDCSYEGDLMANAGISYTVGRESIEQYGESYNGVQMLTNHQFPDGIDPYKVKGDPSSGLLYGIMHGEMGEHGTGGKDVQAYNFRITLTNNPANMIEITKPENYDSTRYELMLRLFDVKPPKDLNSCFIWSEMPNNKTDINNRGGFSTDMIGANWEYPDGSYETREKIFKEHLDYTKGMLYFVGHDPRVPETLRNEMLQWGYPNDEYEDNDHFTPQLYIREARRMIGSMVMTQDYCEGKKVANDPIALGEYNMDSHNCGRYVVNGMVKNEGNVEIGLKEPYKISYRSITPKVEECKNVLVPFCLSASHIAFGSIRMEPIFMVLSEASAIAASIAIDNCGCCVQKVNYSDINEQMKKIR